MRLGINAHLCSTESSCRNAGISSYIRSLVNALGNLDTGADMHLLLSSTNDSQFPQRFHIHRCSRSTENPLARIAWEQCILPGVIKQCKLDIFHSPMYALPAICGCRSVVSILDLAFMQYPETFDPWKRRYLTAFTRRAVKKADAVIAISESTRRDVIGVFGVDPQKVKVTRLAADPRFQPVEDTRRLDPVRAKYGIDSPSVLYLGTLEPRKNLLTLIRAFGKVLKAEPSARLVIAGAEGWLFKPIYRLMDELNLRENIHFTGYVPFEDLPLLYNCADVFVYPSLYEGFGLPPLEAMSCGTPVITSNVSSLPEVVGDAGIMVDPLDLENMAEAIIKLLRNPDMRRDMREKGIRRAAQFSWKRTAEETWQVYSSVYANVGSAG